MIYINFLRQKNSPMVEENKSYAMKMLLTILIDLSVALTIAFMGLTITMKMVEYFPSLPFTVKIMYLIGFTLMFAKSCTINWASMIIKLSNTKE